MHKKNSDNKILIPPGKTTWVLVKYITLNKDDNVSLGF